MDRLETNAFTFDEYETGIDLDLLLEYSNDSRDSKMYYSSTLEDGSALPSFI